MNDLIAIQSNAGLFVFKDLLLTPVEGLTTHRTTLQWKGRNCLFHHDSAPSEGLSRLRSLKVCEIRHGGDGKYNIFKAK